MINFTIDIGNTNVVFCLFKKKKILSTLKVNLESLNKSIIINFLNAHKKNELRGLLSSVVPKITSFIKKILDSEKFNYSFARNFIKFSKLETNLKNKRTVGDDRFVNVIYAKYLFQKNVMIIDFGTATTIDILNCEGVYDGGVITPGINLSLKSLRDGTAKLPLVSFRKTRKVVGRSTVEAIQSGFFWGYVSMIQGLVKKIEKEHNKSYKIILTGGNSNNFKNCFKNIVKIDELFNSKGLNFLINTHYEKY